MMPKPITDFSRLCIHTITTRPWSLGHCAEAFAEAGVAGISVWRDTIEGKNIEVSGNQIRSFGLDIISLVRGGFFPANNSDARQAAIKDNLLAIDEAAALGAKMVVLVCGADPSFPLETSRHHIKRGLEAILPHAESMGVKLAIEPLHPMYADSRSAINTLSQANDMAELFNSPWVGVAVDVYHLWWDQNLEKEITRCGEHGNLFAFHLCDWLSPTTDMLNDRGLMGEGVIDIKEIREWMDKADFKGYHEVEIFSNKLWEGDQYELLKKIQEAYLNHC
jgi:sugar phosphate isomerase/epimerase